MILRRRLLLSVLGLYLCGTAIAQTSQQVNGAVPLEVWGPDGTRDMMRHLEEAFAFDIHVRRDVDENFSPDGIRVIAHDIREGKVYERNGVTVTALLVTHGLVKPSYGYRVDYAR